MNNVKIRKSSDLSLHRMQDIFLVTKTIVRYSKKKSKKTLSTFQQARVLFSRALESHVLHLLLLSFGGLLSQDEI
jgi:hypothetical protein